MMTGCVEHHLCQGEHICKLRKEKPFLFLLYPFFTKRLRLWNDFMHSPSKSNFLTRDFSASKNSIETRKRFRKKSISLFALEICQREDTRQSFFFIFIYLFFLSSRMLKAAFLAKPSHQQMSAIEIEARRRKKATTFQLQNRQLI